MYFPLDSEYFLASERKEKMMGEKEEELESGRNGRKIQKKGKEPKNQVSHIERRSPLTTQSECDLSSSLNWK